MKTPRVAVIGVGGMGTEHLANLARCDVEIAVVADIDRLAAEGAARSSGAAFSLDPESVASDPSIDGLVIASHDDSHARFALAAIAAGTMVLCEKPLAGTLADARAVIDAEQRSGRHIQVGFMREYDPAHRQVKAAVGAFDSLEHVRLVHRNANASRPARSLDEVLVQSVIHDIHSARWLAASEVRTCTVASTPRGQGVGFVHLVLEMDSGSVATIDFDDRAFGYEVAVEASGPAQMVTSAGPGRATVGAAGVRSIEIGTDWFGWFADAYRLEIEAWAASLVQRTVTGPSAWDGFIAQQVVGQVLAAAGVGAEPEPVARPDIYR